ncbi:MAG: hypothetical protein GF307_03160 [candidate division Zixibacteria bacterium]|nr:hypothetical protein [candidate division Zixibacteria bacterium]
MTSVKIQQATDSKGLDQFLKFPFRIYNGNPNWVPHLLVERKDFFNPSKNPFFEHAEVKNFMAFEDDEPAGRISAIINHRHNEFHEDNVGFFGFFECVNNQQTANALYDKAASVLRENGMTSMRGPCNFSTNDEIGFLVEGHDSPPTIMNTYTPEYYLRLTEKYGFEKAMDVLGYYLDDTMEIPERVYRIFDRLIKREGLVIRPVDKKNLEEEVEKVKEIYNKAWEKNWGFVPLTDKEIEHMAADFKLILDPEIALFVEINGKPIGFSLSLPNINEVLIKLNGRLFPFGIFKLLYNMKIARTIKGIRTIILGLLPEYRGKGYDNLLYLETVTRGLKRGYKWAEMGWILETNDRMIKGLENIGGKIFRRYRLYEIDL